MYFAMSNSMKPVFARRFIIFNVMRRNAVENVHCKLFMVF